MATYKDVERGSWYVSFHYIDWTGKNRRKMKRGFKTRREAADWEESFKVRQSTNLDMKFKDFWALYEQDMKPKLKYNTWISKEYIVKLKILPYFEDMKMSEIKARNIIQWQNELLQYRDEKGNPYAPTYLKTCQSQLSAIFNHAVRFYELKSNPVRKAGPLGQTYADEMKFWTKEEYMKFIPEVADKPLSYYSFELLYWCGIRMGELLALTPADFDFENNKLSITKSYQRIHGEDIITVPKTKKSIRTIVMPEMVSREIQDYFSTLYKPKKNERIFPLTKGYLHHEMDRGVKASGVQRIRIHDLRHSHVSLLISMGFSAVAIGNRVGHESDKITYRYAHMFPSVQDEMALQLDQEWKEGFDVEEPKVDPPEEPEARRAQFRLIG